MTADPASCERFSPEQPLSMPSCPSLAPFSTLTTTPIPMSVFWCSVSDDFPISGPAVVETPYVSVPSAAVFHFGGQCLKIKGRSFLFKTGCYDPRVTEFTFPLCVVCFHPHFSRKRLLYISTSFLTLWTRLGGPTPLPPLSDLQRILLVHSLILMRMAPVIITSSSSITFATKPRRLLLRKKPALLAPLASLHLRTNAKA